MSLTLDEKRELQSLLEKRAKHRAETQLYRYEPYPKQLEFHKAGGDPAVRERLLMAGNQLGKTYSAAYEAAMHLTGIYPDWWEGKRFKNPTTAWAASLTSQGTRDTVQRLLLGKPGEWGTGAIPAAQLVEVKRAPHGVADMAETVTVRHITGGLSRLTIKTYDQGRERWQGETLDFVWLDEEPPLDLYMEALTRTNATKGIVWLTFTPLLGMSDVVRRFLQDKMAGSHITVMTIEDALHYSVEERERIISAYLPHEREARVNGTPMMGSGRVFPVSDELLKEPTLQIPNYWARIVGLDFGYDHPTAAVWAAWDRDTDVVHIYDAYRVKEGTPVIHSAAIKARGVWIPVAWPHDGLQHDKGSGVQLAEQYRQLGVKMLRDKASFPDGTNGVEAGLMMMLDRMQTGRLKVAKHLHDWWEEFRLYHRKDGKVVARGDDLMSATRYALMMLRRAKVNMPLDHQRTVPQFRPYDATMGY